MSENLALNLQDESALEQLAILSKDELVTVTKAAGKEIGRLMTRVQFLEGKLGLRSQEKFILADDEYILSREPSASAEKKNKSHQTSKEKANRKPKIQRPSDRWPELDAVDEKIDFKSLPQCKCCGVDMQKMNQREIAESVECVPRRFYIKRTLREKYRCGSCQSNIVTAPVLPRITPGGLYSDNFAIDVATAKYADHLPIERQVNQMVRDGLVGIDHQTLIAQTHGLATYLRCVYVQLKIEVQGIKILHADETPWRMLEGHAKKSWYLWGYFGATVAFYKAFPGRTKDAANRILKDCQATYLIVDGYTGYHEPSKNAGIKVANCWAHAIRYFIKAKENHLEADEMVDLIDELYDIETLIKNESFSERQRVREKESKVVIDKIRNWIYEHHVLGSTSLGEAINYMKKYWVGLTRFLEDADIPLDNNLAERSLRGAVVGRKTYYGNHSERGAETTAILLSICESCKLNKIDPKKYLKYAVEAKHQGRVPLTPAKYAKGKT